MRASTKAVLALLVVTALVVGCGSSSNDAKSASGTSAAAAKSGQGNGGTSAVNPTGKNAVDDAQDGQGLRVDGATGSAGGAGSDGATGAAAQGSGQDLPIVPFKPGDKLAPGMVPEGAELDDLIEVARTSVTDVPMLHNFAVGLGRAGGMPASVTADQAVKLQIRFTAAAKLSSETSGDVAASLSAAFTRYADLAGQLKTAASSGKALPGTFRGDLEAADASWKPALESLGQAGDTNLLANLPPLLMPGASTSTTVPPPPK